MGISVVVPSRCLDNYLPDALFSILRAMEGLESELIIVIPAEETKLKAYLLNFQISNPQFNIRIIDAIRPGIVSALNLGIGQAKYELIARMDADDLMDMTRLRLQSSFLELNPDVVILGSAVTVINQKGAKLRNVYFPISDVEIRKKIRFANTFSHPTVMFRKNAFMLSGGYSQFFDAAEDYDLWTRIIEFGTAANLSVPLLKYREHPNQLSTLDKSLIKKARLVIAFKYLNREHFGCDKTDFINTDNQITVVAKQIESLGISQIIGRKVSIPEYLICRRAKARGQFSSALSATSNGKRKWWVTIGHCIKGVVLSPRELIRVLDVLLRAKFRVIKIYLRGFLGAH